jgi:O-antigen ligase
LVAKFEVLSVIRAFLNNTTITGRVLFVCCLLVFFSANADWRIPVAGRQMHAYLVLLAPLGFYIFPERFKVLSQAPLFYFSSFLVLVLISMVTGTLSGSEIIKIIGSLVTLYAAAMAVKTKEDCILALIGLSVAVSLIVLTNSFTQEAAYKGIKFVAAGNKNAFSLYSIPVFLFALMNISRSKPSLNIYFVTNIALVGLLVMAILVSGNRSGWLIYVLAFLMVFVKKNNKGKGIIIAGIIALSIFQVSDADVFRIVHHKIQVTNNQYAGDLTRIKIMREGLGLVLERPFLGWSPHDLAFELSRRLNSSSPTMDPHNIYLYLIGAFGFPAFLLFLFGGISLWKVGPNIRVMKDQFHFSHFLKILIILWCLRGMFSREVLAAPVFLLSLGVGWGGANMERRMVDLARSVVYWKTQITRVAAASKNSSEPQSAQAGSTKTQRIGA